MEAWFDKNYKHMSKKVFSEVYSEYMDTSGLFLSEDFEKQSFIHHLVSRINYVKIFIRLQREFISSFQMPFIRDFELIKNKYGYVLKWDKENPDVIEFEEQLKKIESREIKHHSFLEEKIKELNELRRKNQEGESDEEKDEEILKKSRRSFIRMLNSLGKIGFNIDKKKTSVEELSLMIKQQTEENEANSK